MPVCKKCKESFPNFVEIDGQIKNLQRRSFCLKCSPYNKHNTRDITTFVKKEKQKCVYCGNFVKKNASQYCSRACQTISEYEEYIRKWKNGEVDGTTGDYGVSNYIRRYIFAKFDNKCSKCGWCQVNQYTGKIPLEIEHIDGNHKNNKEENLDLLCPNCHSLTATYRAANKKSANVERKKYTQERVYCLQCGTTAVLHEGSICRSCLNEAHRKSKRPSRAELKALIRSTTFENIGLMFNVCSNTIRKWCKNEKLPFQVTLIKQISDEDWESV